VSVIWEPSLDAEAARWRDVARDATTQHFAPIASDIDRDGRYPWESVKVLTETGLAGIYVPGEYGGAGAPLTALCAVLEEVAYGCASTCGILAVYLLGTVPFLVAGRSDQKDKYLRGLAERGEGISFGLSEQGAGSDAGALTTAATPEDGGYRIRGEKWFIGNGGASKAFVIFAKTDPEAGSRGISAFAVDADTEGVVVDTFLDKMGIRGTQTTNIRLDAWVPESAMIGERGRGLRLALSTLAVGRLALAGQALGLSRAAYDESRRHAVTRHAFGAPIIDNQGVSFKLADMAAQITAGRVLMYEAARAYDAGEDIGSLGPITKLITSEAAHKIVYDAVQIFGGLGYVRPTIVERLYRDQRAMEIYEGTSEIIRMVLARQIGAEAN
jgi:alkylation response protein AidB-like acyl-CoA dehydrogenase